MLADATESDNLSLNEKVAKKMTTRLSHLKHFTRMSTCLWLITDVACKDIISMWLNHFP
uniref:AlNc14C167G7904 protein n=1 Tax=Albugo laibachii Nc14 TaxID=890382 RepID=F0WN71_9STRA|nr:AlNc14C167G7904 [Albugo laibachii Nc14]|eukprot:CCA22760.1 AlNc14C167G7904 [Albugo laibachii Nc14]